MVVFTVCSDFRAQEEKTCHYFHLSVYHAVMGPDAMILVLFNYLVLCQLFHSPPSPSSRDSLVPLHLLPLEWYHSHIWASLVAQLVKNPPAIKGTWVRSLGWKDPLEKGEATHSNILAWRIPWTIYSSWDRKEYWHDWATFTSLHIRISEIVDVSPAYLDSSL